MAFPKSKRRKANEQRLTGPGAISDDTLTKLGLDRPTWAAMVSEFLGTLVWPGDPAYDADRQEANPAFQAFPLLIAYCEAFSDVALCLQWAHQYDWWVACRAGGHSTAGYSVNNGLVIDVSHIAYVSVNPTAKTAAVGAGTSFALLNAQLNMFNLHVPGGGCMEVCVGGYMQGGGYGFTSREFGIHSDNVVSVLVMLADGAIVEASPAVNADLFWAVRGGTGNNFGVLLEIRYRLHELGPLWGFGLTWTATTDWARALQIMQQSFMKTGPAKLGYMTIITTPLAFITTPEAVTTTPQAFPPWPLGPPTLMMRGVFNGSREEGLALLQPFFDSTQPWLQCDRVASYNELDQYLLETPEGIPALPERQGSDWKEDKQAGYVAKPLSLADWQGIVDYYLTSTAMGNTVVIEPYGGAINSYPVADSAFIHRDVDFDFFVDVFWSEEADRQAQVAWLDGYMTLMQPYFNGHVYQNYPRRTLTNYRWMYWGTAFDTLLRVKQKYDPANFFRFQQSIAPWPPGTPEGPRDTSKPMFTDAAIVYLSRSAPTR